MLQVTLTLLILMASVGLGGYLGLLYLRRTRRPMLIGIHLLLGAGGLELTVQLLRGTPEGLVMRSGVYGNMAAALFAAAMFIGLVTPVLAKARRTANVMVGTHVTLGAVGFLVFLVWIASL